MHTQAVVLEGPKRLGLKGLALTDMTDADVAIDVRFSGISTGTERLFFLGNMPPFPGMGYPLVPGYESVGEVVEAGSATSLTPGQLVFVPGASCFSDARCLFGATARNLIAAGDRVVPVDDMAPDDAVALALAGTAAHALALGPAPDLIVGHGVLGRLLARIAMAKGGEPPVVWEKNVGRAAGAFDYPVVDPESDERRNYRCVVDASGDPNILDTAISRLAPGGIVILAGFYSQPLSFQFPPAFLKEAQIRVAAQWQPEDMQCVLDLVRADRLSLAGLVTHHEPAANAGAAYRTAFEDPACLKMVLDWRSVA